MTVGYSLLVCLRYRCSVSSPHVQKTRQLRESAKHDVDGNNLEDLTFLRSDQLLLESIHVKNMLLLLLWQQLQGHCCYD